MRRSYLAVMILLTFALAISGCSKNEPSGKQEDVSVSENYFIFDTVVSVRVYDERVTKEHFDDIKKLLENINETMNRLEKDSEVSLINHQAGKQAVVVSPETYLVIKTAKQYAELSEGHFDPTVGPLVDLWAIGNGGTAKPEASLIEKEKQLIDYHKLTLDDDKLAVKLEEAGMTLDLGAIAKGYAADVIAEYLQEHDFKSAIIDLGGNILAMGSKPGGAAWAIGIQSPEEKRGAHLGTIPVINKTVVTSGVYERYFIENGEVYHHVLDPYTGYPSWNGLASVTIVTDVSMDADAMSTAVFVMGLEKGMEFVESIDYAEAIFVTEDKKVYVSSGLKDIFKLVHKEYTLAN